ncbi:hypothetical protein N0V82_009956 [Gnomoniopsis sp. IMI 355080]|nr:hypothetical protein N0V82_009956 [Gnomoniopsis sp. IMI 355080]
MAFATLPTLLLVPGAFGTPDGYEKLVPYLEKAGFSTHPGPHPNCNPTDPSTATSEKDIISLRDQVILPLLDKEQKNVVIVAHSYGGVVAGAAAKGLDKTSRQAQGKNSAVVGLIYVAGNITLEGESLLQAVGGEYPPFIKRDKPSKGLALIEPSQGVLYNDCNPSMIPALEKTMCPHALLAFETKPSSPAWADSGFEKRRAYVRTENDACNPAFLQDIWLEKSKVGWAIIELKTGHMPFVSDPEELAAHIVRFVHGLLNL